MSDFTHLSVYEISKLLEDNQISSVELTNAYIENIEKNAHLNAFITVCGDSALASARQSDGRRKMGEVLHPLDGIPFAVKDNLCTAGIPTTCASRMLRDFIPPYTATAVSRLLSAGGILLGKTNMDEFGMGSHSANSFFGKVINPRDHRLSPGGSSGGSAAAVAAGLVPYALGTDTGGSVRLPAAYCGVVGMKPTYGAVSRYGLIAFASSLDHVGVLSGDVRSNALILDTIKGKDPLDATSLFYEGSVVPHATADLRSVRIGVPSLSGISDEVRRTVERSVETLKSHGANICSVTLPPDEALVSAYYVISAAEASSNLARYNGVRYGYRTEAPKNVDELFVNSRTEGFGEEVKRRIMLGTYCLSEGSKQKYYQKAVEARQKITREILNTLCVCDVILFPVSAYEKQFIDQIPAQPLDVYRQDAFTVTANLSGLPALSVPVGEGAVQLMSSPLCEGFLYTLGKILTQEVKI